MITEKTIYIKKAKLKEGFLEAEYEQVEVQKETEDGEEVNRISSNFIMTSSKPVHPDMVEAFSKLTPHMVFMCEQQDILTGDNGKFEDGSIFKDKRMEPFHVTGVSFGGSGDHAGVTLVGQKKLRNKRVLNLVSPFTKFEAGEHEDSSDLYDFMYEMRNALYRVEDEVVAFIKGEKFGKTAQLDLFEEAVGDAESLLNEASENWHGMVKDMADKGIKVSVSKGGAGN